jgi:hypothetical protein
LDNAMYDSTKLGITAKLSTLQVLSQEPMSWFLKIFSPKKSAFLTQNKGKFCKNSIITLVFEKKTPIFFAENSAKIAEKCHRDIFNWNFRPLRRLIATTFAREFRTASRSWTRCPRPSAPTSRTSSAGGAARRGASWPSTRTASTSSGIDFTKLRCGRILFG